MSMSQNASDISIPAALIFIDALGENLPFRSRFTFKELNDFVLREGISSLAQESIAEPDLMKIAYLIEGITNGHVKIVAGPTPSTVRSPLSKIDLEISNRKAHVNSCKRCGQASGSGMLCQACTTDIECKREAQEKVVDHSEPMQIYAHATLTDGTDVHVIEIKGDRYIGIDDGFFAHEFAASEVDSYVNMDESIAKIGMCGMCGAELEDSRCTNCGEGE